MQVAIPAIKTIKKPAMPVFLLVIAQRLSCPALLPFSCEACSLAFWLLSVSRRIFYLVGDFYPVEDFYLVEGSYLVEDFYLVEDSFYPVEDSFSSVEDSFQSVEDSF